jgi:hypothetical protein
MVQAIKLLPLLFPLRGFSSPLQNDERILSPRDGNNVGNKVLENSITYCAPAHDKVPCTYGQDPDSEVWFYMNTKPLPTEYEYVAHFECYTTDPLVGFVHPNSLNNRGYN